MKKTGFLLFASLLFISGVYAKKSIVISNSLNFDRNAEMVEIKTCALKADFKTKSYVLKNEKNQEVPYQLISTDKNKQILILQADVKANSSSTYTLTEGKPAVVNAKTFAGFIPERLDDFAWENDIAAYRMFGPALAVEKPSNGVDFWAKRTDKLVVKQRYKDELENGITYHVDNGNGLDFYKVAHTFGCGGIAPYASDKLWVGDYYNHYKVYENGPLRSVFSLIYDSVKVDNEFYKEIFTVTVDAGSIMNKAEVKYIGKGNNISSLATGIFLHDVKDNLKTDLANGTIAYAENAVSNAGLPSGRNYVGVFAPQKNVIESKEMDNNALLLSSYKTGKIFTYYFGGGWSKWHFPTDNDWFEAVKNFSLAKNNPLKVKIK
ncbi:MAG: DUF4861 family protein [Paludibacter sp.]|nr:DUF4861 family protein [Paludibacter sp.]